MQYQDQEQQQQFEGNTLYKRRLRRRRSPYRFTEEEWAVAALPGKVQRGEDEDLCTEMGKRVALFA